MTTANGRKRARRVAAAPAAVAIALCLGVATAAPASDDRGQVAAAERFVAASITAWGAAPSTGAPLRVADAESAMPAASGAHDRQGLAESGTASAASDPTDDEIFIAADPVEEFHPRPPPRPLRPPSDGSPSAPVPAAAPASATPRAGAPGNARATPRTVERTVRTEPPAVAHEQPRRLKRVPWIVGAYF